MSSFIANKRARASASATFKMFVDSFSVRLPPSPVCAQLERLLAYYGLFNIVGNKLNANSDATEHQLRSRNLRSVCVCAHSAKTQSFNFRR